MDWGQIVLQVLVVVFGGGTVGAILTFLVTRPKVRAEAAAIAATTTANITDASFARLERENVRLSQRQEEMEADFEGERERRRILEQWSWRSQSWMMRAYDVIRNAGLKIDAPPELKFPRREKPNA